MRKAVILFGGSGFLGKYATYAFIKAGYSVTIASRNPERASHLKTCGDVGQVAFARVNIRDEDAVKQAMKYHDVVVNLVGVPYESGQQTFSRLHAQAAEILAKHAKDIGVKKYIHISALGVDGPTKARYARGKFAGERAVRAAFPSATILRPSVVFGRGDSFFTRFSKLMRMLPLFPLICGKTRFQPVYAGDIATAIVTAASDASCESNIYELGGPEIYSFEHLLRYTRRLIDTTCLLIPIPFRIAMMQAAFMELVPRPSLTRDQVLQLQTDNIVSAEALTFEDMGITPTQLESIAPNYI